MKNLKRLNINWVCSALVCVLLLLPAASFGVFGIHNGKLLNALDGNGQDITGLDDITMDALSMTGILTNTNTGTNLDLGVNGGADTEIRFFDDDSDTQRSWIWDDSLDDWYAEDDTGTMRKIWHDGNVPSYVIELKADNTLIVDAGNGDNGTAVRESLVFTYATIAGALTDATAGDTIVVRPGVYNETNLLKNNVDLVFELGANVTYTGATGGGIFDDSSGGITANVFGFGDFTNSGSGTTPRVIDLTNGTSDIFLHARTIKSTVDSAIFIEDGHLELEADLVENTTTDDTIELNGAGGSPEFIGRIDKIIHSGATGHSFKSETDVANARLKGTFISHASSDQPIEIDTNDNTYFENCIINSTGSATEAFDVLNGADLNIHGVLQTDEIVNDRQQRGIISDSADDVIKLGSTSLSFDAGATSLYSWLGMGQLLNLNLIAAGTRNIDRKNDQQFYNVDAQAGAGPYTYNLDLGVTDAFPGMLWIMRLQLAATNPTIVVRDGPAGPTLLSYNSGTAKTYTAMLWGSAGGWVVIMSVENDQ